MRDILPGSYLNTASAMDEFLVTTQNDTTDSASLEGGVSPSPVKSRHHFTVEEDLAMLREVAERNPFGARGQRGASWEQIEATLRSMNFDCTMKSCQDRLARLMRTYVSEETRRNSICGHTINTNPEMANLLGQIIALKAQGVADGTYAASKSDGTAPRPAKKEILIPVTSEVSVLKRTANGLPACDSDDLIQPPSKIARTADDCDGFLRLRKQEIALKREEIELRKTRLRVDTEKNELEKQRLALDRERHEMDRKKQDIEIAERTQQLEMIRQQQQVLYQLLTKKLTENDETETEE